MEITKKEAQERMLKVFNRLDEVIDDMIIDNDGGYQISKDLYNIIATSESEEEFRGMDRAVTAILGYSIQTIIERGEEAAEHDSKTRLLVYTEGDESKNGVLSDIEAALETADIDYEYDSSDRFIISTDDEEEAIRIIEELGYDVDVI